MENLNEKKQIDLISKIIARKSKDYRNPNVALMTTAKKSASTIYHEFCKMQSEAKQREGEWRSELVKRCDWKGKKQQYYQPNSCSLCHEPVLKRTPFCPNCGAKMKGGAE